jgi:hypothetical protein
MSNSNDISAIYLLEKIIDFTSMTPNPEDWSFERQKYNDPRFIRMQQIRRLFWAFIPELKSKEIRDDLENFYSGEFIVTRKIEDYQKLINAMDNTILKGDCGFASKERISLYDMQFNYGSLLNYYIKLNKLISHNDGIMEISYPFYFSYIVTKNISKSLSSKARKIKSILALFIDPFNQKFTMEELIKDFDYPEENLLDIDLDWM